MQISLFSFQDYRVMKLTPRSQIPKQLHITPTDPPNPPYFFAPYLNIKQATNTVLSTLHSRRPLHVEPEPTASISPSETPARTETEDELSEELWPPITTAKKVERYARSSKSPNYFLTITGQLEALGLGEFEGRQHSGIAVSPDSPLSSSASLELQINSS